MKKVATLKYKGLRRKTSNEKRGNPKTQGAQKITEASFVNLTLEGEGDAFRFHIKNAKR
jgi:hypothetical protein